MRPALPLSFISCHGELFGGQRRSRAGASQVMCGAYMFAADLTRAMHPAPGAATFPEVGRRALQRSAREQKAHRPFSLSPLACLRWHADRLRQSEVVRGDREHFGREALGARDGRERAPRPAGGGHCRYWEHAGQAHRRFREAWGAFSFVATVPPLSPSRARLRHYSPRTKNCHSRQFLMFAASLNPIVQAASVKIAALLDKKARRVQDRKSVV